MTNKLLIELILLNKIGIVLLSIIALILISVVLVKILTKIKPRFIKARLKAKLRRLKKLFKRDK